MKEIKLTQGKVALVDDEDFEYLNQFKWYAHKDNRTYYAIRHITVNGKQKTTTMHSIVFGMKLIDHIDGNGLNNQRYNLRHWTVSQNGMNRKPKANLKTIYKGLWFNSKTNRWRASITINKNRIDIGTYKTDIEAAKAYDNKAKELFGDFANLNFKFQIDIAS